jgi:hypothetical protein
MNEKFEIWELTEEQAKKSKETVEKINKDVKDGRLKIIRTRQVFPSNIKVDKNFKIFGQKTLE